MRPKHPNCGKKTHKNCKITPAKAQKILHTAGCAKIFAAKAMCK